MAKKGEATSKKSPTKKVAVAKPVKRLADDKADKPVVQLRKSSRNAAAAKEDIPEPKSVDKVAKKVKVTSEASKQTKKAAAEETKSKEPVAKESDESMEEEKSDAAENSSLVENGDSSADDVKISKVFITLFFMIILFRFHLECFSLMLFSFGTSVLQLSRNLFY